MAAGKVDILTVYTYYLKKRSKQEESNPDGLVYLITTKIPSDGKYEGGMAVRTKAELAKLSGLGDDRDPLGSPAPMAKVSSPNTARVTTSTRLRHPELPISKEQPLNIPARFIY